MGLFLLVGGARSGKSRLAVEIAAARPGPVVFIATAEARDEEMTERIRRHREGRPKSWETLEEPIDLEAALSSVPDDAVVVVDCLTLWVSNVMELGRSDAQILDASRSASAVAAARPSETVVVTNEVGAGIVPANELARRYRDVLGEVNAIWGAAADRAALVVAGRALDLQTAASFAEGAPDG